MPRNKKIHKSKRAGYGQLAALGCLFGAQAAPKPQVVNELEQLVLRAVAQNWAENLDHVGALGRVVVGARLCRCSQAGLAGASAGARPPDTRAFRTCRGGIEVGPRRALDALLLQCPWQLQLIKIP